MIPDNPASWSLKLIAGNVNTVKSCAHVQVGPSDKTVLKLSNPEKQDTSRTYSNCSGVKKNLEFNNCVKDLSVSGTPSNNNLQIFVPKILLKVLDEF